MLSSGGITPISGPQSYGAFSPVQPPVSRNFEFAISSALACGANAVATFSLQDGPLDLGTVSFNIRTGAVIANTYGPFVNPAGITIPATGTGASTGAPSTPYPSTINVAGISGTVVGMSLSLNQFSHTFPSDVDILLVGPAGQKFIPFSDVGGSVDAVNIDITLSDGASALPPATWFPAHSVRPIWLQAICSPLPLLQLRTRARQRQEQRPLLGLWRRQPEWIVEPVCS